MLAGAAALALLGHAAYHYLPRERSAVPDRSDAPARLLDSWSEGAVLWVPYPHQNLAALARVEGGGEALAAAARLAGVEPPSLPRFGPFRAPPARELAVAVDDRGERAVLAARVYPLIAGAARLAGRLAGNPWLAGGEASWRGRSARVAWRGALWQMEVGEPGPERSGPPRPALAGEDAAGEPALAWLRLASPQPPFPGGLYRLRREAGDLQMTMGQPAPSLPGPPPSPDAALQVITSGPALGALGRGALFVWPEGGLGLSGVAVAHTPGGTSWRLPGGSILALTGNDHRSVEGDWVIEALDGESLLRARAAAGGVGTTLAGGVELGVWLQPGPALREVRRIRIAIEAFPLAGRGERQRWRDLERLFATLMRFEDVVLGVGSGPEGRAVLLRLASRTASGV
jgi:hypothetical protein